MGFINSQNKESRSCKDPAGLEGEVLIVVDARLSAYPWCSLLSFRPGPQAGLSLDSKVPAAIPLSPGPVTPTQEQRASLFLTTKQKGFSWVTPTWATFPALDCLTQAWGGTHLCTNDCCHLTPAPTYQWENLTQIPQLKNTFPVGREVRELDSSMHPAGVYSVLCAGHFSSSRDYNRGQNVGGPYCHGGEEREKVHKHN